MLDLDHAMKKEKDTIPMEGLHWTPTCMNLWGPFEAFHV